jgi:hypothetical protein
MPPEYEISKHPNPESSLSNLSCVSSVSMDEYQPFDFNGSLLPVPQTLKFSVTIHNCDYSGKGIIDKILFS